MRCLHHFDADGYGAAAIVNTEFRSVFDNVIPEHFVEYSHNGVVNIKIDEDDWYKENDQLFIVDLALDDTIFNVIKKAISHNMKIVHIDHHISGDKFLNEKLSDEDRKLYTDHVIRFFTTEYSGCMLTWIYSCMNEEERKHPMEIPFDLAPDLAQLAFYPDSDNLRVVGIPLAVRLIDDNDVWRHSLPESKLFAAAWGLHRNENYPLNLEFWNELLYEGPKRAYDIIDEGELIFKFQENMNKSVMYNAFNITIGEYHGIAVNMPYGNSRIFGEEFDKYDFVCKYSQTKPNEWKYTFYSKPDGMNIVDMIDKYFPGSGGGHVAAGGITLNRNLFDGNTVIE